MTDAVEEALTTLALFVEARRRTARSDDLAAIEARMADKLATAFRRQGREFVSKLGAVADQFPLREAGGPVWGPAFDAASFLTLRAFVVAVEEGYVMALAAGTAATVADLGLEDFVAQDAVTVQFLRTRAAELVTGLNDASRAQLQTLLANAVESGQSYKTTAGQIQALFSDWSRDRAQMVAVNEAAMAYTEGQLAVGRQLMDAGIAMGKSWITAGDPCPECDQNESESPLSFGDTFSSGDDGPPGHPRCRCDLAIEPVTV